MDAIIQITSVIGLITFAFTFKQKVDSALATIEAPKPLNFYFLFFWALLASMIGGALWAFCQQIVPSLAPSLTCAGTIVARSPSLGGSREPHGLAALLWPVVTNAPIVVLLAVIGLRYRLVRAREAAMASLAFVFATALASWAFYDLPIAEARGFRCYVMAKQWTYVRTELHLVLIWSGLLAVAPLLSLHLLRRAGLIGSLARSLGGCLLGIGFTMGVVSVIVMFFVGGYRTEAYESARGALAGIFLRVSLFFAVLIASRSDRRQ